MRGLIKLMIMMYTELPVAAVMMHVCTSGVQSSVMPPLLSSSSASSLP